MAGRRRLLQCNVPAADDPKLPVTYMLSFPSAGEDEMLRDKTPDTEDWKEMSFDRSTIDPSCVGPVHTYRT